MGIEIETIPIMIVNFDLCLLGIRSILSSMDIRNLVRRFYSGKNTSTKIGNSCQ